jgi:pimeloyl-ACP methyl ester carboxylesterase
MPVDPAAELAGIMRDSRPVGTRVMARAFAEADLRDVLGTVAVPTLVLHGEADVRSTLAVARALHDAIPGSSLVVLPGLGHEMYLESPETFEAALRSFLDDVRPG